MVWAGEDDQGDSKEQTTRYNRDPSWEDEIAEFADGKARWNLTDCPSEPV